MSDTEDKSSKTEDPTEKKIRDTIEKGNVPISKEASILASFLAIAAYLALDIQSGASRLLLVLTTTFENPIQWDLDTSADALHVLSTIYIEAVRFVLPAAVFLVVGGVVASIVQNPPQINFERIRPKASNVSLKSGITRIFGARGLTEFAKSVFKFCTIGLVVGMILASNLSTVIEAMYVEPVRLPALILELSMSLLMGVSIATILLVAADLALTRIHWKNDIKMSLKDIKDEHKQTNGDPQVKARQRQIGRERARKRMMADVPKATLVVANPTHYAIAMRYVREEGGAPMVLAKGTDQVALKIREIAEENDIPVIEDKLLVRSMYDHVEIDQMIPPEFYKAIAELIYYLHARTGAKEEVATA